MTTACPDDAAVARIAAGVLARSLPKAEWTHAAHFAAALWRRKTLYSPAARLGWVAPDLAPLPYRHDY